MERHGTAIERDPVFAIQKRRGRDDGSGWRFRRSIHAYLGIQPLPFGKNGLPGSAKPQHDHNCLKRRTKDKIIQGETYE